MSLEKQSAVFRQKQWKVTIWYVDFSKAKEQSSISHQPITFNPIPRGETENWKLKSFQAEHFRLESCWNIWFVRSKKYLISYPTWALIRSEPGYRNKELFCLLPLALIRSRLVFRIQVGSECDKHLRSKIKLIGNLIRLGWKNDSNDTLEYDDEAHKAVLFTHNQFFFMKSKLLWLTKFQGWSSLKMTAMAVCDRADSQNFSKSSSPLKVIFHHRLYSTKGCLQSKVSI